MGFGENLQRYLDEKAWKAADLARATGVKPNTLSDILSGETKEPRYEVIQKIVRNTDINPDFLITGLGDTKRNQPGEGAPITRRELQLELAHLTDQIDQRHKELQDYHQEVKTDLEKLAGLLAPEAGKSKPKSGREHP